MYVHFKQIKQIWADFSLLLMATSLGLPNTFLQTEDQFRFLETYFLLSFHIYWGFIDIVFLGMLLIHL